MSVSVSNGFSNNSCILYLSILEELSTDLKNMKYSTILSFIGSIGALFESFGSLVNILDSLFM
jgi:hypothetical protein